MEEKTGKEWGEETKKRCFSRENKFPVCHKSAPDGRKGRAERGARRKNENYRRGSGPKNRPKNKSRGTAKKHLTTGKEDDILFLRLGKTNQARPADF